ncbi:MAG: conjugal transfer protein TraX [Eubacteriales bacterium]|nr:conjugal transfer protein TraX [Eubacteriales bacterium]
MQAQAATRQQTALGGNTDTGWLKIVALVFMIVDHLGVAMFPGVMEMRMLGRIAMPIYAWCLVVGCEYTHDIYRYAFRLLVLAAISQPINMVALGNSWGKLNILFLLCLGVLVIAGIREKRFYSQFWAPLLGYLLLGFVSMDYGWKGLTFILLLYAARKSRGGLAAVILAFALFWGDSSSQVTTVAGMELTFLTWPGIGSVLMSLFRLQALMWLALPFILFQTHTKIKMPKWLGYGMYPLHLLAIILLLVLTGESFTSLLSVLIP